MVIVDTEVIAAAGERYFVAGIGDAMATWFEARVCFKNTSAITPIGARPTLASYAIGEVCAQTLFEKGEAASRAVVPELAQMRLRASWRQIHCLAALDLRAEDLP